MAKCDFCVERLREGKEPACVTGCPTGALGWGELGDDELKRAAAGSPVPGMAQTEVDPSISIVPLRTDRKAPRQTQPASIPPWRALAERITKQIALAHEWPLVVFTTLMAVLAGLFLGSLFGPPAPNAGAFLAGGLAGLLLSSIHLGRKERAWRAASNARRSWLSREVVLFCAFLVLATLEIHFGGGDPADRPTDHVDLSAWLAAACALAVLLSADWVYRPATVRGAGLYHSGGLTGTGLLLTAVWSGATLFTLALAGIKTALYIRRKSNRSRLGLPVRPLATTLRLGTLAAAGVAAWWGAPRALVFGLVVASELVDRAEFYDELEIPTPESLMLDELSERAEAQGPLDTAGKPLNALPDSK
jgi:DMSO reductase anchor subunit